MSIFSETNIEETNDDRRPAWIERKTDHKTYHTVYSLYKEYRDMAEYRFAREKFIEIVKKECPDTVRYRNITYYSWWWFYDNFIDIDKDSYCF